MRKMILILSLLLLLAEQGWAGVKIKNPYAAGGGHWYVGTHHAHSNNSDGTATPEQLKSAYDTISYDYIVSSDHYGDNPSYTDDDGVGQDDGWTADPGGGTITWVVGAEVGWGEGHFVVLGGSRLNWTTGGDAWTDRSSLNAEINNMRDPDSDGDIDAVCILAHPTWASPGTYPDAITSVELNYGASYVAASGIEIANTATYTNANKFNDLTGCLETTGVYNMRYNVATRHWDQMRELWAVGGDDTVGVTLGLRYPLGSYGGFSTVIQTPNVAFSAADLNAAIDSGNCFVQENKWIDGTHTRGTSLATVTVSGATITITYPTAVNTVWYKCDLQSVKTETGVTTTSYAASGTERWVMCQATDSNGLRTWTQPFFIVNDTNIAAGKTVTVSAGADASNIVDGIEATTWDAGAAPSQWFKIDFGENVLINGVEIVWGTADKFNYTIEFSEDDATYYTFRHLTYRNDLSTTFNIGDAYARYLRVTAANYSDDNGGNVVVKECRVFAAPDMEIINQYLNTATGDDNARGTISAPYKTYAQASKFTRSRDRLILQDCTSTTAVSEATYFGKHLLAQRIISGLYGGVRRECQKLVGSTANIVFEDFQVTGQQTSPVNCDGTGVGKPANGITLRRIKIPGAANTSTRMVYFAGAAGATAKDIRIEYCEITDTDNDGAATGGILLYNCAGPATVVNNTIKVDRVTGTASYAFRWNYAGNVDLTIANNIFWSDTASDVIHNATGGTWVITNNCYGPSGAVAAGWTDATGVNQNNPTFVSSSDYRLAWNSPLIDAGTSVTGTHPATDCRGRISPWPKGGTPDIGPYEHRHPTVILPGHGYRRLNQP